MTIESPPAFPPVRLPAGANAAQRALALSRRPIAPADNRGKRVGILIVAFNAVTTLATVLQRIPRDVWDNVEEVVVFDDASDDDTYALAVGYKALSGLDKLTVLRNPQNLGYGGNQKLGYRYFLDKQFDAVVLLHGDGQYAPEVLADLYAPLVAGEADAVFGSRMMSDYGGPRRGGMPLYKLVGNRILTSFENRSLGMQLSEFHSGYRAYDLAALAKIDLSRMTDDFHFDTEIIIKLQHQGFRIREVPIPTFYGEELCYVDGLKYAKDVFRAVLRYRRTVFSARTYREFAEYAQSHPLKESRFSSHQHLLRFCGNGQDVLAVGCGDGAFAGQLAAGGNRVVGVDALAAPRHIDAFVRYIQADPGKSLANVAELQGREFDRVILEDILEHLPDPGRLLIECAARLKPDGLLLVAIPNVANITVRACLLFGRFPYTTRGILDRRHLRFFTRESARKLLNACGLQDIAEKPTVIPIELATGLPAQNCIMRLLNRILSACAILAPTLFAYEFVFASRPGGRARALEA